MTDNEPAYIEIKNLVKTFDTGFSKVEVLKGIDIKINRNETLAVIGTSGVGKSTLLHILGTLDAPTAGTVMLNGVDLYKQAAKSLARIRNQKIGFVFQFHHLLPEFNALENAAMPALIQGESKKDAFEKSEKILTRVGLKDRLRHRVGELSGGEQQRVALARALAVGPELLLADEPTGNLDAKTGQKINELLFELNDEKGLTTVVVTHNLEMAKMMTSQIRLVDGQAIKER